MSLGIDGFSTRQVAVNERTLSVATGGAGELPILLLHGFPETRLAWRKVAPLLAERHPVVCPDLPGYGLSESAASYAKRDLAATMITLMRELGHERFAFVGHDRGGLVAFRAALDHPESVTHVAILDILPTVDMWASLHGSGGVFAFHLFLLAQPTDLPERMIAAAPDVFYGHFFDAWTKVPDAIPSEVRAHYVDVLGKPEAVHAICEDYRASAFVDGTHDAADREAGRTLAMPTLAMWQDPGDLELPFDPEMIWRGWATELRTGVLECGHFLPEERPAEVARAIEDLVR
jgi:pimeloyl-ACP methyl ester carboxylesterase